MGLLGTSTTILGFTPPHVARTWEDPGTLSPTIRKPENRSTPYSFHQRVGEKAA